MDLFELRSAFASDEWDDSLESKRDNLCGDSEVDHLLPETVRVDGEVVSWRCLHLFLVLGEGLNGETEDVKVRYENGSKGDVDKGSQKNAEIGSDKVQNEDLRSHRFLVSVLCFVILELRESCRKAGQERGYGWKESRKKDCGYENEDRFEWTIIYFGDEDFDAEACAYQGAESNCCKHGKWNL